MARRLCVLVVAVLALMVGAAAAQDAKAVLQAASTAMGAANLRSVQITGTGWNAAVGQSFESGGRLAAVRSDALRAHHRL